VANQESQLWHGAAPSIGQVRPIGNRLR